MTENEKHTVGSPEAEASAASLPEDTGRCEGERAGSGSATEDNLPGEARASRRLRKLKPYDHWKRRAYMSWALVGIGVVGMGILYVAGVLWQPLAVVAVAALVTFLFHAPVDAMERKGIPRVIGTAVCLIGLLAIIAVAVVAVIPTTVTELGKFASSVPSYAAQVKEFADNLAANGIYGLSAEQVNGAINQASSWVSEQAAGILGGMASGVVGGVIDLGTGVMIAFIAFICAFWLLIDLPRISREVRILVPDNLQDDFEVLSNTFGTAIYGWLKATLVCALLTGVATFVSCTVIGIPYAVVLAIMCAVFYVIPYIGPFLAAVLVGVVGLIVSPGAALAGVIAVIVIINAIANFVSPKLMEDSVNVHPAVILVVIMAGGALGGVWGMLASIPIAAALQGLFVTYFEAKTGKKLARPDGAFFRGASPDAEKPVDERRGLFTRISGGKR